MLAAPHLRAAWLDDVLASVWVKAVKVIFWEPETVLTVGVEVLPLAEHERVPHLYCVATALYASKAVPTDAQQSPL